MFFEDDAPNFWRVLVELDGKEIGLGVPGFDVDGVDVLDDVFGLAPKPKEIGLDIT